jgi:putative redox protein
LANEINVTFPANLAVEASVGDFTIRTDQPEKSGGDNSAPSPSELFTTSVATCAGYFALKFCRARKIDTTGMRLTMQYDWDKELKRYPKMSIQLELPDGFPEKYRGAIIKAMDQCAVKRSILQPPEFEMTLI